MGGRGGVFEAPVSLHRGFEDSAPATHESFSTKQCQFIFRSQKFVSARGGPPEMNGPGVGVGAATAQSCAPKRVAPPSHPFLVAERVELKLIKNNLPAQALSPGFQTVEVRGVINLDGSSPLRLC